MCKCARVADQHRHRHRGYDDQHLTALIFEVHTECPVYDVARITREPRHGVTSRSRASASPPAEAEYAAAVLTWSTTRTLPEIFGVLGSLIVEKVLRRGR